MLPLRAQTQSVDEPAAIGVLSADPWGPKRAPCGVPASLSLTVTCFAQKCCLRTAAWCLVSTDPILVTQPCPAVHGKDTDAVLSRFLRHKKATEDQHQTQEEYQE